jgi:hypothetical protein
VVAEQPNRLSAIAFGVFALAAMLPGVATAKAVPPGRYECWFYTTPQHLKDFTLSGSAYTDASGVSGSVTISGNKLAFRGGNLDGRTGIYNGGNPPTISFYNADGEEVLLCQRGSWNRPPQQQ